MEFPLVPRVPSLPISGHPQNMSPAPSGGPAVSMSQNVPAAPMTPADVHVLLVDHERLSRLVVGNLFRRAGYQVTVAGGGRDAIQKLQSKPDDFNLLVTDVVMPDIDGLQLIQFMQQNTSFHGIPVIAMSASADQGIISACLGAGATECLVKPVTKKEVQQMWQHVWRRQRTNSRQSQGQQPVLQLPGVDMDQLKQSLPSSQWPASPLDSLQQMELQLQQRRNSQHLQLSINPSVQSAPSSSEAHLPRSSAGEVGEQEQEASVSHLRSASLAITPSEFRCSSSGDTRPTCSLSSGKAVQLIRNPSRVAHPEPSWAPSLPDKASSPHGPGASGSMGSGPRSGTWPAKSISAPALPALAAKQGDPQRPGAARRGLPSPSSQSPGLRRALELAAQGGLKGGASADDAKPGQEEAPTNQGRGAHKQTGRPPTPQKWRAAMEAAGEDSLAAGQAGFRLPRAPSGTEAGPGPPSRGGSHSSHPSRGQDASDDATRGPGSGEFGSRRLSQPRHMDDSEADPAARGGMVRTSSASRRAWAGEGSDEVGTAPGEDAGSLRGGRAALAQLAAQLHRPVGPASSAEWTRPQAPDPREEQEQEQGGEMAWPPLPKSDEDCSSLEGARGGGNEHGGNNEGASELWSDEGSGSPDGESTWRGDRWPRTGQVRRSNSSARVGHSRPQHTQVASAREAGAAWGSEAGPGRLGAAAAMEAKEKDADEASWGHAPPPVRRGSGGSGGSQRARRGPSPRAVDAPEDSAGRDERAFQGAELASQYESSADAPLGDGLRASTHLNRDVDEDMEAWGQRLASGDVDAWMQEEQAEGDSVLSPDVESRFVAALLQQKLLEQQQRQEEGGPPHQPRPGRQDHAWREDPSGQLVSDACAEQPDLMLALQQRQQQLLAQRISRTRDARMASGIALALQKQQEKLVALKREREGRLLLPAVLRESEQPWTRHPPLEPQRLLPVHLEGGSAALEDQNGPMVRLPRQVGPQANAFPDRSPDGMAASPASLDESVELMRRQRLMALACMGSPHQDGGDMPLARGNIRPSQQHRALPIPVPCGPGLQPRGPPEPLFAGAPGALPGSWPGALGMENSLHPSLAGQRLSSALGAPPGSSLGAPAVLMRGAGARPLHGPVPRQLLSPEQMDRAAGLAGPALGHMGNVSPIRMGLEDSLGGATRQLNEKALLAKGLAAFPEAQDRSTWPTPGVPHYAPAQEGVPGRMQGDAHRELSPVLGAASPAMRAPQPWARPVFRGQLVDPSSAASAALSALNGLPSAEAQYAHEAAHRKEAPAPRQHGRLLAQGSSVGMQAGMQEQLQQWISHLEGLKQQEAQEEPQEQSSSGTWGEERGPEGSHGGWGQEQRGRQHRENNLFCGSSKLKARVGWDGEGEEETHGESGEDGPVEEGCIEGNEASPSEDRQEEAEPNVRRFQPSLSTSSGNSGASRRSQGMQRQGRVPAGIAQQEEAPWQQHGGGASWGRSDEDMLLQQQGLRPQQGRGCSEEELAGHGGDELGGAWAGLTEADGAHHVTAASTGDPADPEALDWLPGCPEPTMVPRQPSSGNLHAGTGLDWSRDSRDHGVSWTHGASHDTPAWQLSLGPEQSGAQDASNADQEAMYEDFVKFQHMTAECDEGEQGKRGAEGSEEDDLEEDDEEMEQARLLSLQPFNAEDETVLGERAQAGEQPASPINDNAVQDAAQDSYAQDNPEQLWVQLGKDRERIECQGLMGYAGGRLPEGISPQSVLEQQDMDRPLQPMPSFSIYMDQGTGEPPAGAAEPDPRPTGAGESGQMRVPTPLDRLNNLPAAARAELYMRPHDPIALCSNDAGSGNFGALLAASGERKDARAQIEPRASWGMRPAPRSPSPLRSQPGIHAGGQVIMAAAEQEPAEQATASSPPPPDNRDTAPEPRARSGTHRTMVCASEGQGSADGSGGAFSAGQSGPSGMRTQATRSRGGKGPLFVQSVRATSGLKRKEALSVLLQRQQERNMWPPSATPPVSAAPQSPAPWAGPEERPEHAARTQGPAPSDSAGGAARVGSIVGANTNSSSGCAATNSTAGPGGTGGASAGSRRSGVGGEGSRWKHISGSADGSRSAGAGASGSSGWKHFLGMALEREYLGLPDESAQGLPVSTSEAHGQDRDQGAADPQGEDQPEAAPLPSGEVNHSRDSAASELPAEPIPRSASYPVLPQNNRPEDASVQNSTVASLMVAGAAAAQGGSTERGGRLALMWLSGSRKGSRATTPEAGVKGSASALASSKLLSTCEVGTGGDGGDNGVREGQGALLGLPTAGDGPVLTAPAHAAPEDRPAQGTCRQDGAAVGVPGSQGTAAGQQQGVHENAGCLLQDGGSEPEPHMFVPSSQDLQHGTPAAQAASGSAAGGIQPVEAHGQESAAVLAPGPGQAPVSGPGGGLDVPRVMRDGLRQAERAPSRPLFVGLSGRVTPSDSLGRGPPSADVSGRGQLSAELSGRGPSVSHAEEASVGPSPSHGRSGSRQTPAAQGSGSVGPGASYGTLAGGGGAGGEATDGGSMGWDGGGSWDRDEGRSGRGGAQGPGGSGGGGSSGGGGRGAGSFPGDGSQSLEAVEEEEVDTEVLLEFLLQVQKKKQESRGQLSREIDGLHCDAHEVQRRSSALEELRRTTQNDWGPLSSRRRGRQGATPDHAQGLQSSEGAMPTDRDNVPSQADKEGAPEVHGSGDRDSSTPFTHGTVPASVPRPLDRAEVQPAESNCVGEAQTSPGAPGRAASSAPVPASLGSRRELRRARLQESFREIERAYLNLRARAAEIEAALDSGDEREEGCTTTGEETSHRPASPQSGSRGKLGSQGQGGSAHLWGLKGDTAALWNALGSYHPPCLPGLGVTGGPGPGAEHREAVAGKDEVEEQGVVGSGEAGHGKAVFGVPLAHQRASLDPEDAQGLGPRRRLEDVGGEHQAGLPRGKTEAEEGSEAAGARPPQRNGSGGGSMALVCSEAAAVAAAAAAATTAPYGRQSQMWKEGGAGTKDLGFSLFTPYQQQQQQQQQQQGQAGLQDPQQLGSHAFSSALTFQTPYSQMGPVMAPAFAAGLSPVTGLPFALGTQGMAPLHAAAAVSGLTSFSAGLGAPYAAPAPSTNQRWLGEFYENLSRFTRCVALRERAAVRHGDTFASSGMVCALSFDRDNRYIASAGVCRRIKVFDCEELLHERTGGRGDIHYPAIEMAGSAKLSCVCWSPYSRNVLASTDYKGLVQVWDAFTQQTVLEYAEHKRRTWSVHFSRLNPMCLASGSDDGSVKLWSLNQARSTGSIKAKANVCSVHFSPRDPHILVFGSADYKVSCFDLRKTKAPLCSLAGHGRAVSYVTFCGMDHVVSASTDNSLKLWDMSRAVSTAHAPASASAPPSQSFCLATFSGHTNEKNFVGLSVSDEGYIACGSENNSVYVYHKGFPVPITSHKFQATDPVSGAPTDDDAGQFVSSVCWRQGTSTLVAANSMGNIKLLDLK